MFGFWVCRNCESKIDAHYILMALEFRDVECVVRVIRITIRNVLVASETIVP